MYLELSKVLMYEFHYDYFKNEYGNNSRLLLTYTDSLMYKIKTSIFDFSNYSTKSKYYDNASKLVFRKVKDETSGVATETFIGLKPQMYSLLVDDNSEYKYAKRVNKNVVATIGHNEYKDVLLNKKSLRHSMNTNQSKDQRIGIGVNYKKK